MNCYRGHNINYSEYNKIGIVKIYDRNGRLQLDNKEIALVTTKQSKAEKFEALYNIKIERN